LGTPRALTVAAILHGLTVLVLAALPLVVPQLGAIYWAALVAVAVLLVWEHSLVAPGDLSRVNAAFFDANAIIGVVLLAAIGIDLWW
jgi:4-hydroxybenzoate polyprenyltransferase